MTEGLEAVELLIVRLPLKRPFRTSFGTSTAKECVLVRAIGPDGAEGWGESTAVERPAYSGEYVAGSWAVLRDHLVPAALAGRPSGVRGHAMSKAALEVALVDLELRRSGTSLASHLGGVRDRVPCGVSLGIEERMEDLLEQVGRHVEAGYRRVKLKIEPGHDVEAVRAVPGVCSMEDEQTVTAQEDD